MPTYEYECAKCGKQFELFQSMKDAALKVCPKEHCQMKTWGKGRVKRLLGTGAGLIFKGSGFYITDYRSDSYKQSAKKESGAGESKPSTDSSTKKADNSGSAGKKTSPSSTKS